MIFEKNVHIFENNVVKSKIISNFVLVMPPNYLCLTAYYWAFNIITII